MSESILPQPTAPEPTFEEALVRLERVVAELEDGSLGLADALTRYEEGIRCLKQCHRTLEQAERKIEILAGVDAQGQPVVQPLADDALSLEQKAEARSRRRSRTTRTTDAVGPPAARVEADNADSDGESIDRGRSLF